jgi:anaerobic selenocysteine-containing dehydrogenase
MDRRRFIKISALTGTSATLASCGNPEYHLIRFAPEDRLVPGIEVWKPSICPLCPAGCGLTVRVMEGDAEVMREGKRGVTKMGLAKKLEGDPQHPVNQGKLCTRGLAAIEITYHPDRVGHPLKRAGARGDGKFEEISWEQALSDLIAKLDALAASNNQKALTILMARRNGMRQALMTQFADQFGAPGPIAFEFFDDDVVRRANRLSFGREQLPTLDLAESKYVISFGADFLGTWNSPVSQNVGYGHMRQGRPGDRGKFVQVEYRMSQTGANADEWLPVKPGTEGVLALGLAHVIMKCGERQPADAGRAGLLIEGWMDGLSRYTPEEVEKKTGAAAKRVERLANEFAQQTPAIAIAAGAAAAHTNGLFNAVAVNALTALVGSVEIPGGIYFTANSESGTNFAKYSEIGVRPQTQILLVDGANPVFASPHAWAVKDALMKIPYIVSFGNFIDETSVLSDLILPDHSFLESWVHAAPESGAKVAVSTVAPPVMQPLHDTRSTPDVLLEVSRKISKPLNLPWQKFEDMLKAAPTVGALGEAQARQRAALRGEAQARQRAALRNERPGRSAERKRDSAQPQDAERKRDSAQPQDAERKRDSAQPQETTAPTVKYTEPEFDGDPNQYGFLLLPYPSIAFLDGSLAHLPLLQELPDPMTSGMWSSWVEINTQTAERLGIRQGDLVEITSSQGSIQMAAFLSPGVAPDVIAIPVGQGHENYTRYATDRGQNPIRILAPMKELNTGALAWAATKVRIAKVANSDGRLVLFAGSLREYPEEKVHR